MASLIPDLPSLNPTVRSQKAKAFLSYLLCNTVLTASKKKSTRSQGVSKKEKNLTLRFFVKQRYGVCHSIACKRCIEFSVGKRNRNFCNSFEISYGALFPKLCRVKITMDKRLLSRGKTSCARLPSMMPGSVCPGNALISGLQLDCLISNRRCPRPSLRKLFSATNSRSPK